MTDKARQWLELGPIGQRAMGKEDGCPKQQFASGWFNNLQKEFSGPSCLFLTNKCQRFPNKNVVLSSLSVFCFLADSPLIYQQSILKVFSLSSCRPLPIISSLRRNLGHVLHPNWMCGVLLGTENDFFFIKKHGFWKIKMLQYHERKKPGPRANI